MPSSTPKAAATAPSTTPSASTIRRRCAGVPPAAATSPRSRRRRRAPTANAGPASRMISSIASPPRSPGTPTSNRFSAAVSSGYRSAGLGGCASTWRETATTPRVLSCLTCAQVSGPGVAASQRSSRGPSAGDSASAAGGSAPGRSTTVVARRSVGSSTVPTTRKVRLPSARRTLPPTSAPRRRTAAGVRAASSRVAGARPVSWRKIPCASGSVASSIRPPTVPVPAAVRTCRGPVWSRTTLLPGGRSASSFFAVSGGAGSAVGGSAPGGPNASRSVGSWCTGSPNGRASTAWAVPISRSARSSGVSVNVSM
jgi:hypothetical protein